MIEGKARLVGMVSRRRRLARDEDVETWTKEQLKAFLEAVKDDHLSQEEAAALIAGLVFAT